MVCCILDCAKTIPGENLRPFNLLIGWKIYLYPRKFDLEKVFLFESQLEMVIFLSFIYLWCNYKLLFNWQLKLRTLISCFRNNQFWQNDDISMLPERSWYFNAPREIHFYVASYASKSWIVTIILRLSQKVIFIILILSFCSIMLILTPFTLLYLFKIPITGLPKSMMHSLARNLRWYLLEIPLKNRM